jgi:hypothetical protein
MKWNQTHALVTGGTCGFGRTLASVNQARLEYPAASQIVRGIESGKEEIYVGASALLRVISRISPSLAEAIMIKR